MADIRGGGASTCSIPQPLLPRADRPVTGAASAPQVVAADARRPANAPKAVVSLGRLCWARPAGAPRAAGPPTPRLWAFSTEPVPRRHSDPLAWCGAPAAARPRRLRPPAQANRAPATPPPPCAQSVGDALTSFDLGTTQDFTVSRLIKSASGEGGGARDPQASPAPVPQRTHSGGRTHTCASVRAYPCSPATHVLPGGPHPALQRTLLTPPSWPPPSVRRRCSRRCASTPPSSPRRRCWMASSTKASRCAA